MAFSVVVFPQPLGPMITSVSEGLTSKATSNRYSRKAFRICTDNMVLSPFYFRLVRCYCGDGVVTVGHR